MIELGDEVEDITSKMSGIIIAKIEYLDGDLAYLIQPPRLSDDNRPAIIEVAASYLKKTGDGVRVEERKPIGFK